jgi:hypothetical protein
MFQLVIKLLIFIIIIEALTHLLVFINKIKSSNKGSILKSMAELPSV